MRSYEGADTIADGDDERTLLPERPAFVLKGKRIRIEIAHMRSPQEQFDFGSGGALGEPLYLCASDFRGRAIKTTAELLFPEENAEFESLIEYLNVAEKEAFRVRSVNDYVWGKTIQCVGYTIQAPARPIEKEKGYPIEDLRCWRGREWNGISTVGSCLADGTFSEKHLRRIQARWLASFSAAESQKARWIDALPFPLASILQTYAAAGGDEKRRYESLLLFFEALAAFQGIVLWSAISRSPRLTALATYPYRQGDVGSKDASDPFENADFGSWVRLAESLAAFARPLINGERKLDLLDAFATDNETALEALFSRKVVAVLQFANSKRNDWRGHGGASSDEVDLDRHTKLREKLEEIRPILAVIWDEYTLYVADAGRFKERGYDYACDRLMGTATPLERVEVRSGTPIEADAMFLMAFGEERPLPLEPLLLLAASPKSAKNACYFFNKRTHEGLSFVSYHFGDQPRTIAGDNRHLVALQALQSATKQSQRA